MTKTTLKRTKKMLTRLIPVPLGSVGIGGSMKEKGGNVWNRTAVVLKVRSVPNHFQGCGRPTPNFGSETTQHKIYQDFWEISEYSISISNIDAVNIGHAHPSCWPALSQNDRTFRHKTGHCEEFQCLSHRKITQVLIILSWFFFFVSYLRDTWFLVGTPLTFLALCLQSDQKL